MRVAIIGLGRMGCRHIEAVRAQGYALVGIADQQEAVVTHIGDQYGIDAHARFTDAASMLAAVQPDMVIIATTAPSHAEYVCLAATAGARAILCEKPMAVSLADCDRMIDTCARTGTRLAINHQMRFMDQYHILKQWTHDAAFGEIVSMTAVGGNVGLAMVGSHYIELFRYLTDDVPTTVTAWFSPERVPNPRGAHFEDRAGDMRVSTRQGRRLYLNLGADQGHGRSLVIAGRFGLVILDEMAGIARMTVRAEQDRELPTTRYSTPGMVTTRAFPPFDIVAASQAMLQAIDRGEGYPTGEDGRLAIQVLVGAYLSDECDHQPVEVNELASVTGRCFPWA